MPAARARLPRAAALLPYLERIDEARWYSNFGPLVTEFEARLAARLRAGSQAVTVANATTGLALGLRALDPPAGALCALPAWTFVATAHAVAQAGLVPWFVDVDPESWMLDPAAVTQILRRAPGPVAAVAPVAAFGRMPDLFAWRRFQDETGVPVLVDGAAAFDGLQATPVPVVVSLHATKALGVGEGGYLATEDAALAARFRELTSFGFRGTRTAHRPAANAKLSEYAAAVGLAGLDAWPATRLRYVWTARRLRMALTGAPSARFQPGWGEAWVASVCTVRLPEGAARRAEAALNAEGIGARSWWSLGCHREPAFADAPCAPLPHTERLASSTLGLPYWADMEPAEVDRVAAALHAALGRA